MKKIFLILFFLGIMFITTSVMASTSDWQQISEPRLLSETSGETSMVVDNEGVVYAAFEEFYTKDSRLNTRIIVNQYIGDEENLEVGQLDFYDSYSNFVIKTDSDNDVYLAFQDHDWSLSGSATNWGAFVVKNDSRDGSWDPIGEVGDNGFFIDGHEIDNLAFEISPDDSLYVAFKDISDSRLYILKYTSNVTSDTDWLGNDGWEFVFEDEDIFSEIDNFDFSIGSDGSIFLGTTKNFGTVTSPDYKTNLYKYDGGWVSLRSAPLEAGNLTHYLQANDNGFYLYFNEETSSDSGQNKIFKYTEPSGLWQTITSGDEEFLDDNYNFKYLFDGTPFAIDSEGNLNLVYGNTDATLKSWDNPWGSATVMKYDSGNWDYVGSKRFSQQNSMYFSIGAASNGELYVICRDGGENDEKAIVYKFGETSSEIVEPPSNSSQGSAVAENSGEYGTSPVTGQQEAISEVGAGQFIRSYSFSGIYYIDEDMVRHPFWDANSFFTYADSWNDVVWVTDATLPTMTLGSPMLPKEGVVLVKIQSDPKVYAIDNDNTLRWVPDETTALSLYGTNWADYVIDLEPTTFARYSVGEKMTQSESVDVNVMKTRFELIDNP